MAADITPLFSFFFLSFFPRLLLRLVFLALLRFFSTFYRRMQNLMASGGIEGSCDSSSFPFANEIFTNFFQHVQFRVTTTRRSIVEVQFYNLFVVFRTHLNSLFDIGYIYIRIFGRRKIFSMILNHILMINNISLYRWNLVRITELCGIAVSWNYISCI